VRRYDLPALRAAWWATRAARSARRHLARSEIGVAMRRLPRVPDLPDSAVRGVDAVLVRRGATCLVRSIVRQAWLAAHGRPVELVIGVTAPGAGFAAHAWLEGDPPPEGLSFKELTRRAPV
jgi:hypothetical protein